MCSLLIKNLREVFLTLIFLFSLQLNATFQGFQPAAIYQVGNLPEGIAVGDFNKDGNIDLAIANSVDGTISILLGKSDGTFQPQVTYSVGSGPSRIAVGDFNEDSYPDLAVTNSNDNTVSILINNGDGTFTLQTPPLNVENTPIGIAVGDFDGDGHLDIAVANYNSGTVSILIGNGNGNFHPQQTFSSGSFPVGVAVGIFDNSNSFLDLAVTNEADNTLSILLGNGDGTFLPRVPYPTGAFPQEIAVGDFNHDGILDLAVTNNADNTVSIFIGNGDGSFKTQVPYSTGNSPQGIAVGDFNNDGNLDLAVANLNSNTFSILFGNGNGTFLPQIPFSAGMSPREIVVGNFNGDSKLDLALTNGSSFVSIFLQKVSTTTSLFVSPNSSIAGQTVNLTATIALAVSSPFTPTGTVSFFDGVTFLGEAPVSGGTAVFSTQSLTAGTHSFTALYSGDANFVGSTSPSVMLVVNKVLTTTILTISPKCSTVCQKVNLKASVDPFSTSSFIPTGTVSFFDGNALLATVSLSNFTATFSKKCFTVGTHVMTAVYSGDINFVGSSSSIVILKVNECCPQSPPIHLKKAQKENKCAPDKIKNKNEQKPPLKKTNFRSDHSRDASGKKLMTRAIKSFPLNFFH